MPKFRADTPQQDPCRSSLQADKVISLTLSLPWAASLPLTSLSQWRLSVSARPHQFHRCRRLAPRPVLEMSQLNEGASARRKILLVQFARFGSGGIHSRSPSRDASCRVVCEALLSAFPAPREIRRNRIGACGLCRTSLLEICQSPILASWSSTLHRNFINGLAPTHFITHRFVHSQPPEAPKCAACTQNTALQQCVYKHEFMQYKDVYIDHISVLHRYVYIARTDLERGWFDVVV
jgi:hypothetical protein